MQPMSPSPRPHESFKARLREAIDEQGLTIAELARRLDPEMPERAERNLYRWLSPTSRILPSRASQQALAEALGLRPDFFGRKRDPGAQQTARLVDVLIRHLQARYSNTKVSA